MSWMSAGRTPALPGACQTAGQAGSERVTLPGDHCMSRCRTTIARHSADRLLRFTLPGDHCASRCRATIACHSVAWILLVTLPSDHCASPCQITIACHSARRALRVTLPGMPAGHLCLTSMPDDYVRHPCPVSLSHRSVSLICPPDLSFYMSARSAWHVCHLSMPNMSVRQTCRNTFLADLPAGSSGMDASHIYCDTLSGIYAGHTCQASCRGRVRVHIDA